MREHTVNESSPSTLVWAGLEELFRQQAQSVLQALLEEEVTEFLGRVKSQRRDPAGAAGTAPAASRSRSSRVETEGRHLLSTQHVEDGPVRSR